MDSKRLFSFCLEPQYCVKYAEPSTYFQQPYYSLAADSNFIVTISTILGFEFITGCWVSCSGQPCYPIDSTST